LSHLLHEELHSALARHPRTYPLQTGTGESRAWLSAEQGSGVPSGLLYTSLTFPSYVIYGHSTSPDHITLLAQHFRSSSLLSMVRRSVTLLFYRTVSVTWRSPATASDSRWKRTYFVATTQHTQRMTHDSALYEYVIEIDITFPSVCNAGVLCKNRRLLQKINVFALW